MPKRAIYQRKVDGKWAVGELPDDDKDGDRLPSRAPFGFCRKRLNLRRTHALSWKSIRRKEAYSADL